MLPPTDAQFFSAEDPTKPDIAFLKNHFYREGRLTEEQALFILSRASDILKNEPNLLEVDAPITGALCGAFPEGSDDWPLIRAYTVHSLWRHSRTICTFYRIVQNLPVLPLMAIV